jgi:hypothetical protein
MTTLDLIFDGNTFPVPKRYVIDLLEHRGLFAATSYAVESSVPLELFEAFVDSLKTQAKITVTQGNAVSLWFLAKEFSFPDLKSECATFSVSVDHLSKLSERFSEMEHH